MLNLKIIIGSTRPGRAADRIVPWISRAGPLPPAIMRRPESQGAH